jgi:signal transduction histidine kinase
LKENLAGLGEMSAGIAHEFRNSLATILGYARLIGRRAVTVGGARSRATEGSADCGHVDHAGAIVREVESIGRVVEDFLRYARPAALHASQWDPRAVMAEVAAEAARDSERPGVTIAIGGEWPGTIRADEGLLRQAFGNLLRNALEAIPSESGLITVTGVLEEGGVQLRIEVADSGIGIPSEVLARLFTPFVTTKQRGTGLGLALAQKAIVSHDGAITARNAESGGACFTVTLPVQG